MIQDFSYELGKLRELSPALEKNGISDADLIKIAVASLAGAVEMDIMRLQINPDKVHVVMPRPPVNTSGHVAAVELN